MMTRPWFSCLCTFITTGQNIINKVLKSDEQLWQQSNHVF
jgi:hypothetical protein